MSNPDKPSGLFIDPSDCRDRALRLSRLAARAPNSHAGEAFAKMASGWHEIAVLLEKSYAALDFPVYPDPFSSEWKVDH